MMIQNVVTTKGRAYMEKCIARGLIFKITRAEIGTGMLTPDIHLEESNGLIAFKAYGILRSAAYKDEKITFGVQFVNTGIETFFKVTEIALYANDPDVGEIKVFHTYYGTYGEAILPESENLVIRNFDLRYDLSKGLEVTTQISPEGIITERDVSAKIVAGFIPRANGAGKLEGSITGDAQTLQGADKTYFAAASHRHDNASAAADGFLAKADKEKLDKMTGQVTQNLTPESSPTFKEATIGGVKVPGGVALAAHRHDNATTAQDGFMSKTDKTAHNTLVERVNQGVKTTDNPTFQNITLQGGVIYGAKYME